MISHSVCDLKMWNALRQEHLIQSAPGTVLLEYCLSPVHMNDVFKV